MLIYGGYIYAATVSEVWKQACDAFVVVLVLQYVQVFFLAVSCFFIARVLKGTFLFCPGVFCTK